jgi:hypothetical protein
MKKEDTDGDDRIITYGTVLTNLWWIWKYTARDYRVSYREE